MVRTRDLYTPLSKERGYRCKEYREEIRKSMGELMEDKSYLSKVCLYPWLAGGQLPVAPRVCTDRRLELEAESGCASRLSGWNASVSSAVLPAASNVFLYIPFLFLPQVARADFTQRLALKPFCFFH